MEFLVICITYFSKAALLAAWKIFHLHYGLVDYKPLVYAKLMHQDPRNKKYCTYIIKPLFYEKRLSLGKLTLYGIQ